MAKMKSEQLRDNVIDQLSNYEKLLRTAEMDMEADQIAIKISEYMQGLFSVMFTGAFDVGKSTILNALMRQNLLTVSINPETPVITKIINGEDSDRAVIKYRDKERPDEVIPLADFAEKYRLEFLNERKFAEVSYVELTRKLKSATVVFVDSPGLENTTTDDAAANEFAEKADAIVFMIHATMAMNQGAKEYVERNFRRRQLKNVFFVVNWYNMVPRQNVVAFHKKIQHDLYDVFTDENGNFNQELYDSRVFFVDALTSFCARTGTPKEERKGVKWISTPIMEEDDEYTGVPDFEKALYEFLDADDRDVQGYQGFMPRMASMFSATCDHISEIIQQSTQELYELQNREKEQRSAIDEIIKYLDDINNAVDIAVREMLVNTQSAYQNFSNSVSVNWDNYFKGKKVSFGVKEEVKIFGLKAKYRIQDIFDSDGADQLARDKEFEELMAPIMKQVEEYIHIEVNKMADRISADCEPAIQRLVVRLKGNVESIQDVNLKGFDFNKLVSDIVAAGRKGSSAATKQLKNGISGATDPISGDMSLIQAFISGVLLFNFDDMITGAMGGKKSWGTFIKDNLLKEICDYILAFVVASIYPPAWIYYAARAIWGMLTMVKEGNNIGAKILLSLKEAAVQSINDAKEDVSIKIESAFNNELTYKCDELIGAIELGLKQKQKQLQDLIQKIESGKFDADATKTALLETKSNMIKSFNDLSKLLGNGEYTEEQILEYATLKI